MKFEFHILCIAIDEVYTSFAPPKLFSNQSVILPQGRAENLAEMHPEVTPMTAVPLN